MRRQWRFSFVLLMLVLVASTRDAGWPVLGASGAPPSVAAQSPMPGATNVSTRTTIAATFSQPVQPASVVFELRTATGTPIPTTIDYDAATLTATLTPSADLAGATVHTASLTAATDLDGNPLAAPSTWSFTTATPQFVERIVFSGLTSPTAIEFASDGRVFVAEKSGLIKVFDSLTDSSATVFADLRTNVHNFWDRGMLGMALHPDFPTVPYVYVLYAYDAAIGSAAPRWGTANTTSDPCPTPPGATADGCVIGGRLSRLQASGNAMVGQEQVLIEDWFQQYPSHSIGSLAFGADGALYASGGDGASFNFADFGQDGNPVNPGGDPPVPVGGVQTAPSAEGGALRSQDLQSSGDPVTLDGTLIRVDPMTGAGMPDNPLASNVDANARRIVAYGLRNPFRITARPGANQIYIGDVGWNIWEEINRIAITPGGSVVNFGWPCYEGVGRQSGYDAINLNLCENLYTQPSAVVPPLFTYNHSSAVVSGETCPTGSSSISGLAFYQGTAYPTSYAGALFFSDYSRNCIWVMFKDANGDPNPATRQTFKAAAAGPVQLKLGPDGNLYYVDIIGTIRRFEYYPGNLPPTARATANPTTGDAPLTVTFDGNGSSDPDAVDTLSYAWDFNGDSVADATTALATHTFIAGGTHAVRLTVSDNRGLSHAAVVSITVDSSMPTAAIDAPTAGTTWRVGDTIAFSGHATDPEEGTLPPTALTWSIVMNHCSPIGGCHVHPLQDYLGVAGASFVAPDHEYPSHLELRLTATDSSGLQSTVTRRLDPQTVALTFATAPSGLQLGVGSESAVAPFTRTVIVGSNNSVTAPSPQTVGGTTYQFQSWSDAGAQTHAVVAPAGATTYTATFTSPTPVAPTGLIATTAGANRVTLAWSNVAGETGYRVERSVGGGAFTQVGTTATNVVTFTNTGLTAGTTYTYRVKAYNAAGDSTPSATAQATTLPAVIRINFQPAASPVPSGYLVDSGAAYGSRGNGFSYGWNAANNNTRDRNSTRSLDQRYDTLNHMQRNGTFTWSLAVPNGSYRVRIVAGDATATDSYYRINVESTLAINQRPSTSARWVDRTVTVTVSDGRLNVTNATSASNNKVNFVEVTAQQ
jgi:glucose/arabinose dehydrogenase